MDTFEVREDGVHAEAEELYQGVQGGGAGAGATSGKSVGQVASELDLTETAVRLWVRQAAVDPHRDPQGPLTSEDRAELASAAARAQDRHDGEWNPYYRLAALGLGLLALAAALSRRRWVNGAAAGVLLLVVAQLTIDHYSEARATRYAGQLGAVLAARP